MGCDKCKTCSKFGTTLFQHWGRSYKLCDFCTVLCERLADKDTRYVEEFMKPDAIDREDLPLSLIERNVLRAREARAKGRKKWAADTA